MDIKYVSKIIHGLRLHDKDLYEKVKKIDDLEQKEINSLFEKTVLVIHRLRQLGTIKNRYKKNLCVLVFEGLLSGKISVISMNSHALSKNKDTLRDKPQYDKNNEINLFLETIAKDLKIKISYTSILADLDTDFKLDEYKEKWNLNKEYLEKKSGTNTARLSEIMKEEDFSIYNSPEKILKMEGLDELIKKYKESQDIKIDFNTPEDFIRKQIISYVTVGIILERRLPDVFILDIQRKYYPFEQPFYNYARRVEIPIIYCGY